MTEKIIDDEFLKSLSEKIYDMYSILDTIEEYEYEMSVYPDELCWDLQADNKHEDVNKIEMLYKHNVTYDCHFMYKVLAVMLSDFDNMTIETYQKFKIKLEQMKNILNLQVDNHCDNLEMFVLFFGFNNKKVIKYVSLLECLKRKRRKLEYILDSC